MSQVGNYTTSALGTYLMSALLSLQLKRISLALLIFSCCTSSYAESQFIGNWRMQFQDKSKGTVIGYATVSAKRITGILPSVKNGFFRSEQPSYAGNIMKGSFYPYLNGVRFDLTLVDENTLSGFWRERGRISKKSTFEGARKYDNPEKPDWHWSTGRVVWKKMLPKVSQVRVFALKNGALDFKKMQAAWKYAAVNANLPRIGIDLSGEDLPLHPDRHSKHLKVQLYDPNLVYHTASYNQEAGYLRLNVWLRKGVSPGQKLLTINGVNLPWQLQFSNYDEPELKSLTYVQSESNGYLPLSQIAKDQIFQVEAKYSAEPYGQQRTAVLEWSENKSAAILHKTADKTLFRSKPTTLEALLRGELK